MKYIMILLLAVGAININAQTWGVNIGNGLSPSEIDALNASVTTLQSEIQTLKNIVESRNTIVKRGSDWKVLEPDANEVFIYQEPQFFPFYSEVVTTSTDVGAIAFNQDVNFPTDGSYRIGIGFGANNNETTNRDAVVEILFDGGNFDANSVEVFRLEAKDEDGVFGNTGTDQKHRVYVTDVKNIIAGSKNITITIKTGGGAGTNSSIWSGTIFIQKIY